MATMTYRTSAFVAAGAKDVSSKVSAAEPKPGFFSRIFNAIADSRMRKAEIEVRRVRALLADPNPDVEHALLPFRGE